MAGSGSISLKNFAQSLVAVAGKTGRKTPVRELLIFPFGDVQTTYGSFLFDEESGATLMERYARYTERRDGWLDIDIAHLSQVNEDSPMAHVSAGKFRLDLRSDGQWLTDITYTPEVFERVANEELKYGSPVISFDDKNRIVGLHQFSLTNIPAMFGAQPLALSQRSKDFKFQKEIRPMKFSRLLALSTLLSSRVDADQALLSDRPSMNQLMQRLSSAVRGKFGEFSYVEDVWEDYLIICVYGQDGEETKYFKASYSVSGEEIVFEDAVEVIRAWEPKMEAEKSEMMSQRLQTTEKMLLDATGAKTVAGAITTIETLRAGQKDAGALAERLARLETKSFDSQRQVLLSQAKQAGKWTAKLEALADRAADRARKLGDDPVLALSEVFEAAPVVIAPGREVQNQVVGSGSADGLTREEQQICMEEARRLGVSPEVYQKSFSENRRRFVRG